MLDKLRAGINYDESALISKENNETGDLISEKAALSLWERLKIFLLSFFNRDKYDDVLKGHLLNKNSKEIKSSFSGFINFENKRYLAPFYNNFEELANSIAIFKKPLDNALSENRQEFYAFLGGDESPNLQQQLIDATNPYSIAASQPDYDSYTLRTTIKSNCSELIREIIAESRSAISGRTRSLAHLERLTAFNFDKALALFSKDKSVSYQIMDKPLKKLNAILYSFQNPPSARLLELLFLFSYKCNGVADDLIVAKLEGDLKKAIYALEVIKKFNKFPLTKAIKVLEQDYFYKPDLLSGGEDWANLYQKFWTNRADKAVKFFIFERKYNEQVTLITILLNEEKFPLLPYYSQQGWPEPLHAIQQCSLALVNSFFTKIYDYYQTAAIKPLLENANFFKKDNKAALLEVIDMLAKVHIDLNNFAASIMEGDLALILNRGINDKEGEAKQQDAAVTANRLAATIVQNAIDAMRILTLIFEGIVKSNIVGGKFGGISNLGELDLQKVNFSTELNDIYNQCAALTAALSDMKDLEERMANLEREVAGESLAF
ncbi:MAG: DUF5312 domain-containing protein [Spirochaetaceae bacterium]|nr:DUF5312 domain-containing protein [Spirochaetaceae bacterium]